VSKKKKIILHGYLKDLYDLPIEVECETVAEAIRSLQTIPELVPKNGLLHPITVQGVNSEIALYAKTPLDEIHVYPRTGGAGGKNGMMQIILGIALIAVLVFMPVLIPQFLINAGLTQGMVFMMGASLLVGGLIQTLMAQPEDSNRDSSNSSKYLGSSANTVRIGTNIGIMYGVAKVGGHYLSYDVDAKDIAVFGSGNEEYDGAFVEYDKPILPDGVCPISPIYASATPSSSNIPTSAWYGV
jgi:predicted phage tail protein